MTTLMALASDVQAVLSPISAILVGISAVFAGWFVWSELPAEKPEF